LPLDCKRLQRLPAKPRGLTREPAPAPPRAPRNDREKARAAARFDDYGEEIRSAAKGPSARHGHCLVTPA